MQLRDLLDQSLLTTETAPAALRQIIRHAGQSKTMVLGAVSLALAVLSFSMWFGAIGLIAAVGMSLGVTCLTVAATLWRRKPISGTSQLPAEVIGLVAKGLVFECDAKGQVTRFLTNPQNDLGLPSHLVVGSGMFDRVHVTDRVAFRQAIALADGSVHQLRIRLPQNGENTGVRFLNCELKAIRLGTGDIDTARLVVIEPADESESLRAQLASLEEQQHQLAAAKSGFLASASHELRTPLNAILGFSDILLLGVAGELASDKHREYVTLIRESGAHLLSVVNTILDMSKLESGHYSVHREEIELPAVVAMCEAMVAKPAADKAVTIAVDIADDVQVIDTDRRAFRQILINLLSNAVKFSHRAGKVSVTVRREGADNVLRVADCGIGMGQEFIDKVGTPFLQAQTEHTRQYEGTGLGLSVVKGLVGVLSGTLLIESGQGTGTTVTIRLPVDEQSTRPDKVIRFQERTGERNDKTIRKSA